MVPRCSCAAMHCFIELSCICGLRYPERSSLTRSWQTTINSSALWRANLRLSSIPPRRPGSRRCSKFDFFHAG